MSEERRYCARDFTSGPRQIRNAHYDRLREFGVPADNAARIAAEAVDKTVRKIDQGPGLDAHQRARAARNDVVDGGGAERRNPFRVRFDFEPETAGITLDRS